jgi:alkaline phosphatase
MNHENVGFLIELGDFKDMAVPSHHKATLDYLHTIEKVFSRFRGDRYHVLGNHDEDCISKEDFYSIAKNSGIESRKTWYAFQKAGYHFIVLDACFDSAGVSYEKGNFDWSDANIPASELKWLDSELSGTKSPVILFVHQLLYGTSKTTVKNAAAVRAILEKHRNVTAVFHGHEHSGGYEKINGIHYYTLKGMIEGSFPGSNCFAIVTLSADSIVIRGYGKAVSMTLPLPN